MYTHNVCLAINTVELCIGKRSRNDLKYASLGLNFINSIEIEKEYDIGSTFI